MPFAAFRDIVNLTVICVELTTTVLLRETPEPVCLTVDPGVKPVPVNVTLTLDPLFPLGGLMDVSAGVWLLPVTVKVWVLLVPAVVDTDTLCPPMAAAAPTVRVAVICVALTTVTLPGVTPLPLTATVAPATKLVPLRETFTAVPCGPLLGVTDVKTGAAGWAVTVK